MMKNQINASDIDCEFSEDVLYNSDMLRVLCSVILIFLYYPLQWIA